MIHKHIIHQLIYEIDGFKNNSEFQKIANRLSSITRSTFQSRVNALLDKYSIENYHLIINSLELDLGYINGDNIENSILISLERALEKKLRNIYIESKYKIKHGLIKINIDLDTDTNIFYEHAENAQANTSVQISKELKHYLPSKVASKVIPEDAKYLDAVIHYLQYGWLPKYLDIPMYQFDDIFTETIMKYSAEIKNFFGRKSRTENDKVQQRIIQQISKNKFSTKSNKQKSKIVETIFRNTSIEYIQIVIKAIEQLSITKNTLNKNEKTIIIEVLSNLYGSSNALIELTTLQKKIKEIAKGETEFDIIGNRNIPENLKSPYDTIDSKKQKANLHKNDKDHDREVHKSKSDSYLSPDKTEAQLRSTLKNTSFSFSTKDKFEKKISELLDSTDKSSFNSLINSTFFKSLVKSYEPGSNKTEIIIRKFIPLLINPKDSENIIAGLPAYIDSEEEIINQLYKTSPLIIAKSLNSLSQYEKNKSNRIKGIIALMSKISKRRINLVLQSYFSNFTSISSKLNALNKYFEKSPELKLKTKPIFQNFLQIKEISFQAAMSLESSKFIHTYLIIAVSQSKETPVRIIDKFFKEMNILLGKEIINLPKKLPQKLKNRIFKKGEDYIHSMTFSNIERDYNISDIENKVTTKYLYTTLLKDNYIPSINKKNKSMSIKSLIKKLETHITRNTIPEITKLYKEYRIYKNPILTKLTTSEFKRLLGVSLSTEKARFYIKFFEKYHYLWKVKVDPSQIQLIFLSLIKYEKVLTEKNIFHYFYEELKIYKSWTYDVHKKLVIEVYETHTDKLNEEERELMIQYIDSIPTYQSLEFRDTKKKLSEGIPVKNAGLVLLWPFFKTLFGVSEYLDNKGDFKDSESRERATLLLQYLAVMSSAVEEPYLALNKIMTGFPLEESLPKEIILTDKEKDIADALLLNVIKQWPSFQNSTTDNLRGSFIIRDGILSFKGNQWVLRVESKAYDLLLSKLPWGFSMIRLSWIPYIIKVEWN